MKAIGRLGILMALAYLPSLMEADMRDRGTRESITEKVSIQHHLEQSTMEIGNLASIMG
jgi:hypothetical protein